MTVRAFYIFLAIIVFSGLVHVHHRGNYWKKLSPYNFSFPHEKMSWDWFEIILWSLHLSNPKEDEEDENNDCKKKPNFRLRSALQNKAPVYRHCDSLQGSFPDLSEHLHRLENGCNQGSYKYEAVHKGKAHNVGLQTFCTCGFLSELLYTQGRVKKLRSAQLTV